MGNFEKLSVLVIVVIIVMILVVALYTWTGDPSGGEAAANVPVAPSNEGVHVDLSQPGKDLTKGFTGKGLKDEFGGGKRPDGAQTDAEKLVAEMLKDRRAKEALAGGANGELGEPKPVLDTPKPDAPKEPRVHVVVAGDTIGRIAKLEYPGVGSGRVIDSILKANPTVDANRLAIGFKLVLPELGSDVKPIAGETVKKVNPAIEAPAPTIKPGTIYVTKKGDTLKSIASRAYRDSNQWHRVWVENFDEISDTDHLAAGMRLRVPVLER